MNSEPTPTISSAVQSTQNLSKNNVQNTIQDDEIDLFELGQSLWLQKKLIALITTAITGAAVIVALMLPKTYETTAIILPPNSSQIEAISLASLKEFGIEQPDTSTVYKTYLEQLSQTETFLKVLEKPVIKNYFEPLALSDNKRLEIITNNLKVILPTEAKEKLVFKTLDTTLKFEAQEPQIALEVVNALLQAAAELSRTEIKQNLLTATHERISATQQQFNLENERVHREIDAEIKRLQDQDTLELAVINQKIDLLREKAKQERQYRIERLKVDFEIAKTLKIELPVNPQDYNRQANSITKVDFSSKDPSRYWLGTKTLALEIKSLENRQNEDAYIEDLAELFKKKASLKFNVTVENLKARTDNLPFSDDLRALKTQLDKLQLVQKQIEKADFSVYRMVKPAYLPEHPIKPKKSLIVAVALVLGGMLGVFVALIVGSIRKRREETV
jgi:LPS O-antigen subunit length determinant protein (WzzB/FepE family)